MQSTIQTPSQSHKNGATQAQCLDQLCRLENRLTQLQQISSSGPSQDKLDVAKMILVELTDFAESNFGDDEFDQVAAKIHAVYKRTKQLDEKIRDAAWSSVKRLLGRDTTSGFEVTTEYEGLRKDYSLLFVEFFVQCLSQFEASTDDKKSFLEGVDLFVTEFAKAW